MEARVAEPLSTPLRAAGLIWAAGGVDGVGGVGRAGGVGGDDACHAGVEGFFILNRVGAPAAPEAV